MICPDGAMQVWDEMQLRLLCHRCYLAAATVACWMPGSRYGGRCEKCDGVEFVTVVWVPSSRGQR